VHAPKKIHLVTQAYLRAWSSDGLLRPVSVRYGRQKLRSCAAVGWRREWWGSEDSTLNTVCEESCGKLEMVLPDALDAVEARWPLCLSDRAVIAQFLALHVLRTDAFADGFGPVRDESLARFRRRFPSQDGYERWRREMQSDRHRANKLLGMINKFATIFASMHWTLLRFEEPLLVTGDQPVCPVPLLTPGLEAPIGAVPRDGWLDTCEVRCPLTPDLALLASWHMGPPDPVLAGTWGHAVNINASVVAQSVEQYFQNRLREPAMPPAIWREPQRRFPPISIEILEDYSLAAAVESPLRAQTKRALEVLIEKQDRETITVITPATGPARPSLVGS
jgi:hypothetical protein